MRTAVIAGFPAAPEAFWENNHPKKPENHTARIFPQKTRIRFPAGRSGSAPREIRLDYKYENLINLSTDKLIK